MLRRDEGGIAEGVAWGTTEVRVGRDMCPMGELVIFVDNAVMMRSDGDRREGVSVVAEDHRIWKTGSWRE